MRDQENEYRSQIAARLAQHATPGSVAMTHAAWQEIQHDCQARSIGVTEVKGKPEIELVECYALRDSE